MENNAFEDLLGDLGGSPAKKETTDPPPIIEVADSSTTVTEDQPVIEAPTSQKAISDTSQDPARPAQSDVAAGEKESTVANVQSPSADDALKATTTTPALEQSVQSALPAQPKSSPPAPQKVERVDSLKQAKEPEPASAPVPLAEEEDASVQPPRPEVQEVPAPTHPSGGMKQNGGVPTELPVSDEAHRIAQLLTISPDFVNININVGFNTKFAVEEILRLRKEIAELKEENRRLRSRVGEDEGTSRETQVARMSTRELHATLLSTEARVKELELENGRTRIQMAMMPERLHNPGHAGRAWD